MRFSHECVFAQASLELMVSPVRLRQKPPGGSASGRGKAGLDVAIELASDEENNVKRGRPTMRHAAQNRCLWLAAAAIAFVVGQADAATTVHVGNRQGNFAKNGVDVQVVDLGGASKIYQAMIAGSIDMSLAAGTDVPFIMKGVPETGVGAIAITPALLGIVVPWNSPIHTLADLKGKKIGFSTVGSLTQWVAFAAVHKAGLTPNDITGVTDGSTTPPQIAALETGQVDAQVSAVALGWNLEQQKKGRLLASASEFVGP